MLVLSQRSGFAHERGRLPGEGRPMLRHRSRSKTALRKRNDAASAATANLYDDETAGNSDANADAKHTAAATFPDTEPDSANNFDSPSG